APRIFSPPRGRRLLPDGGDAATLRTSRAWPHNPALNDLEHELRRRVEGDVRFDTSSRLLYATDASMYQMEPIGVVIPRHAGDVQAAVEIANQQGVPLLPR